MTRQSTLRTSPSTASHKSSRSSSLNNRTTSSSPLAVHASLAMQLAHLDGEAPPSGVVKGTSSTLAGPSKILGGGLPPGQMAALQTLHLGLADGACHRPSFRVIVVPRPLQALIAEDVPARQHQGRLPLKQLGVGIRRLSQRHEKFFIALGAANSEALPAG
ncbi:hypothetical protein MKX07_000330 [Trichoderma sp. CBMAI-0711]|nr:hypothetical protein MKX07_000330 [Trichoderma sp. CBMAI-0711]